MPHILMVVGAVLALAGIGGVAAGAPDWLLGLSLGATLIQSGTIAFVGGILLIAIALVLYALQDLLQRLETLSAGAPVRPSAPARESARPLPAPEAGAAPRPPRPMPAAEPPPRPREELPPADAEEQPRSRRDLPARFDSEEPPRSRADVARSERSEEQPRPRRETPPPIISAEEPQRARRDAAQVYGFEGQSARRRERSLEQTGHDIERLRTEFPFRTPRDAGARPRRDSALPALPPLAPDERARPRAAAEQARPAPADNYVPKFRPAEPAAKTERAPAGETVVKSGVIGGMAYTLYADGSIEAELPIGTVRFASIAELQDHVTRTGAEADADFGEQNR